MLAVGRHRTRGFQPLAPKPGRRLYNAERAKMRMVDLSEAVISAQLLLSQHLVAAEALRAGHLHLAQQGQ